MRLSQGSIPILPVHKIALAAYKTFISATTRCDLVALERALHPLEPSRLCLIARPVRELGALS